ncbi:MAG: hypothetical protein WCW78_01055 [Candidatus Paceibacterota bacterium]|jgi:hypothetical protein
MGFLNQHCGLVALVIVAIALLLAVFGPYIYRRFIKTPPTCPKDGMVMKFDGYYRDVLATYKCEICGTEVSDPN